jgi:hypothetical protein
MFNRKKHTMIEFIIPTGQAATRPEPYTLRLEADNDSPTIALLANNFPDAETFLDHFQAALSTALPGAAFKRYAKPNASIPATEDMLTVIAEECDALVTAWGHRGSCTSGTVRDAINGARHNLPSVAFVTEAFWTLGDSVAEAAGMPSVPRVRLPHPVSGTGHENMNRVAHQFAGQVVALLRSPGCETLGPRRPPNPEPLTCSSKMVGRTVCRSSSQRPIESSRW